MPILKNPTAIANAAAETSKRLDSLDECFAWFNERGYVYADVIDEMLESEKELSDVELAEICGGAEAEIEEMQTQTEAVVSTETTADHNQFETRDADIEAETVAAESEFSGEMAGPDAP